MKVCSPSFFLERLSIACQKLEKEVAWLFDHGIEYAKMIEWGKDSFIGSWKRISKIVAKQLNSTRPVVYLVQVTVLTF